MVSTRECVGLGFSCNGGMCDVDFYITRGMQNVRPISNTLERMPRTQGATNFHHDMI